ncbi:unnamed protein product [Mytilus coruscus]|uniref:Uncharacterized protein n=1 Tax=Mytilus coruscus TaxID=42192 RepID=A0A6J8B1L5_MYTCO|nr:unnamed protein product [Mytilus coruscus]
MDLWLKTGSCRKSKSDTEDTTVTTDAATELLMEKESEVDVDHCVDDSVLPLETQTDEIMEKVTKIGPSFELLRNKVEEHAAYCANCLVFGDGHGDGMFAMIGFRDWKNASGDKRGSLKIHENSKLHSAAKEKADNLIMVSNESKPDICSSLSKAYENKVVRNRQILLAIIDVIVSLRQRNITLRGNWDKELKKEDGNFQYFVDWVAKFDEI